MLVCIWWQCGDFNLLALIFGFLAVIFSFPVVILCFLVVILCMSVVIFWWSPEVVVVAGDGGGQRWLKVIGS